MAARAGQLRGHEVEPRGYRYNTTFFQPVICHVCKWLYNGNTEPCSCGMISYCDRVHSALDRDRTARIVGHNEICQVVQKLIREGKMRNYSPLLHGEWYYRPFNYVKIVKEELQRDLHPHERSMLLSARSCLFCHHETGLRSCTSCYCVDFCEIHHRKKKNHKYHKCEDRWNWLYLSMQTVNLGVPWTRTFHNFPDKCHVEDMVEFYESYVLPAKTASWTVMDIVYSDYVSWPLTTYYALREAELFQVPEPVEGTKRTYVIHILEARKDVDKFLPYWEIFLHVFGKPTELIVVMVGAQIAPELAGRSGTVPICNAKCANFGHELRYEYHRMLYHDYASDERKLFKRPNVIVGFHVRLSGGESWTRFISSLEDPDIPFILTTRTRVNARRHLKRIQKALSLSAKPYFNRTNKFSSRMMTKDVENGRVYYHNEHLLVYRHLHHMDAFPR
ncbi:PREDICTED: uncharacterized protein LOC106745338 [Dinoponera quadriceps]|uniref:Uncharacterized protein LOC106745338 n=1 Tax=Dinoponera quadriceps TaxID=609295 RepID=A0A6P3XDL4_DINQU|nr:PREDICTED: uncharacterized protein LOC106745338 [Dinoponera quadriceps]